MEDKLANEPPTAEVAALCTLLARILCRGLAERDPRTLALLASPTAAPTPPKEKGTSDHAA